MTDEQTLQSDDEQFEHAISHAQMMWRLSYKHEVERRNEKMKFNEAMANESMAATIEQDRQNNIASINERARIDKQLERQRKNSEFWHRVMKFVSVVTVLAVAYQLFIMWWG